MFERYLYENGIPERIFSIQEIDRMNEDLLWEMAKIQPKTSGVPYKIWLDPMGVTRGNEHTFSPRLKVEVDGNFIPVEISGNPKIPDSTRRFMDKEPRNFNLVYEYIKAYKDIFLAHYFGEIDDKDVLSYIGTKDEAKENTVRFFSEKDKKPKIRVVYHFEPDEIIFSIKVVEDNGKVLMRDVALDRNELFKIANELKDTFDAVGIYEE